jgi:hypothetical protein
MKAIYSSIVAPYMVAKHNCEHYPITSGGKGTRAIKIGRLNTCTVRTKLNNWGRKRCHNHNGHQQFPNRCAKILTGGTQEVLQKVVPDEKPSCEGTRRLDSFKPPGKIAATTVPAAPSNRPLSIVRPIIQCERDRVAGISFMIGRDFVLVQNINHAVGSVLVNSTQLYRPSSQMIGNYCNCNTICPLRQALKVSALQPPGRVHKVGFPMVSRIQLYNIRAGCIQFWMK